MKFNPISKELFTDDGRFLKRLQCPYTVQWQNMVADHGDVRFRTCSGCDHPVLDTAMASDAELVSLLQQAPATCLKVDLEQSNLKVIHHAFLEKKV